MIESVNKLFSSITSHILLYHSTYKNVPFDLSQGIHNVNPDEFFKQILWLKKNFDIVSIDEYFSSGDFTGKAAITFDDAYKVVFSEVVPFLVSESVPSTIFVNGITLEGKVFWRDKIRFIINNDLVDDFIDFNAVLFDAYNVDSGNFYRATKSSKMNSLLVDSALDRYIESKDVSLDSLKNCVDGCEYFVDNPLVSFGNHTYSHYVLSSLSREQQEVEIKKNIECLGSCFSNQSRVFSIPFGGDGDFNADTLDLLKDFGYSAVLYSNGRLNGRFKCLKNTSNPLLYGNRYMVKGTFDEFQKQIFKLGFKSLLRM